MIAKRMLAKSRKVRKTGRNSNSHYKIHNRYNNRKSLWTVLFLPQEMLQLDHLELPNMLLLEWEKHIRYTEHAQLAIACLVDKQQTND